MSAQVLLDSIAPAALRGRMSGAASSPPPSIDFLPPERRPRRPRVRYGRAPTPFGEALLGGSAEGLCLLCFPPSGADDAAIVRDYLSDAQPEADPETAATLAARVFQGDGALRAWVSGTPFQLAVWRTLAALPPGRVIGYGALAAQAGSPRAARAVGTAMAVNPLAWLVPCHRVVRSDGVLGRYRSGTARKAAMLGWEAANGGG